MFSPVALEERDMVFHRETSPLISRDRPVILDTNIESDPDGENFKDPDQNVTSPGTTDCASSISYRSTDNCISRICKMNGGKLKLNIPSNNHIQESYDQNGAEPYDQDGGPTSGLLAASTNAVSPAEKVVRMLESSGEFVEPVSVTWRNINVYVPPENKNWCSRQPDEAGKQILKNVTGSVSAGKLLAILGASGGGKTTLLNVLNYRNREKLVVSGEILINGVDLGKGIRNLSAYVQQHDMFIGMLTVREHLIFRAMLRMDKRLSKAKRIQRVNEVMNELGLTKCADTLIGIPGRRKGISGGEMKRLSFASEILTNPPLIFCDEPTSGLDSYMAANVIQTLSSMSNKQRTVVCVIHQPSSDVYNMFDEVMYMTEGHVAFMGPLNDATTFFTSMGYPCPQNYNPADHIINTLAVVPGKEYDCWNKIKKITDTFKSSQWMNDIEEKAEYDSEKAWQSVLTFNTDMIDGSRYVAPWCRQFYYVVWRTFQAQKREPYVFKARTLQILVVTLLIGLIYRRDPYTPHTQKSVSDLNGLMFFMMTNLSFTYIFAVQQVFYGEIPIFLREHATGLYYTTSYFFGKNAADIPFYTFLPTLFIVIVYWMGGLNPNISVFFVNLFIGLLICNIGTGLGYTMPIAIRKFEICLLVTPTISVLMMMMGGFFINTGSLPFYFKWMKYISWFYYGNEAYVINQWHDVNDILCIENNGTASDSKSCYENGIEIIEYYGFDPNLLWLNIGILAAILAFLRLLGVTILHIRAVRTAS